MEWSHIDIYDSFHLEVQQSVFIYLFALRPWLNAPTLVTHFDELSTLKCHVNLWWKLKGIKEAAVECQCFPKPCLDLVNIYLICITLHWSLDPVFSLMVKS